jgi:integrase
MAQDGSLYAVGNTCYLKYYNIVDGKRVHKTIQLCKRSDVHDWWKKRGKWGFSSAVEKLQRETMDKIRAKAKAAEDSALAATRPPKPEEMSVVDFWEMPILPICDANGKPIKGYLAYLEEILPLTGQPRRKPETIRGFKQIWKQHLSGHFAGTPPAKPMTLCEYQPKHGKRFLRSLIATQGKTTLKHIKALASSIFSYAVEQEILTVNPWREVKIPKDAIESAATLHYTLPEVEDIITSLVEHVDCQLVMALACFLGLRPGEIAALRWEDFDADDVHIRRSVVRGVVGTPKTAESLATLPLPVQVILPLELWRRKSRSESEHTEGYVFESKNATPVDLHNLIARVIRPHVEGKTKCIPCNKIPKASGVRWKTLYAGRRCAATAVIEVNNGNLAIGQALLRHKSQITTATFYKRAVTPETLRNGMKMLEAAATASGTGDGK